MGWVLQAQLPMVQHSDTSQPWFGSLSKWIHMLSVSLTQFQGARWRRNACIVLDRSLAKRPINRRAHPMVLTVEIWPSTPWSRTTMLFLPDGWVPTMACYVGWLGSSYKIFAWLAAANRCWTADWLACRGLQQPEVCLLVRSDCSFNLPYHHECVFARQVCH